MNYKKAMVRIFLVIILLIAMFLVYFFFIEDPYRDTNNDFVPSDNIETVYSFDEAKEDIDYVFNLIKSRHYSSRKSAPKSVQDAYDEAINLLSDQNTFVDIWRCTSILLHSLDDAHSSSGYVYSDSTPAYNINIDVQSREEWYITIDQETYRLTSIYNISVEELYDLSSRFFSYENQYYLNYLIESKLQYPVYSALLTGVYHDQMTITYESNGSSKTISILPVISTYIMENAIEYNIDNDAKIALLSLRSMIYNQEAKDVLEQFFKDVKTNQIQNVAIDLRDNSGGNSLLIQELFRYLDMEEYKDYGTSIRYQFFSLTFQPRVVKNEKYSDYTFYGDLYLLTSNKTFSSAAMLTALFRDNQLGLIYGEPIGNEPSMFGDILRYQMPNSKLAFVLTYKLFTRPNQDLTETTINPDILVTQEDAYNKLLQDIGVNTD